MARPNHAPAAMHAGEAGSVKCRPALMNTVRDTLSPKPITTEAFTDVAAAVGRLQEIYGRKLRSLAEVAFQ